MSFSDVTRGQGSFVSRTKSIDRSNSFKVVKSINDEIFEPTGSNYSTSFMVVSQSSVAVTGPSTRFNANLARGGSIDGVGLEVGRMYDIALSFVSSSISGSTIDLFR